MAIPETTKAASEVKFNKKNDISVSVKNMGPRRLCVMTHANVAIINSNRINFKLKFAPWSSSPKRVNSTDCESRLIRKPGPVTNAPLLAPKPDHRDRILNLRAGFNLDFPHKSCHGLISTMLSGTIWNDITCADTLGIILCMRPANERRRYIVTPSLIGWAHTQTDHWFWISSRVVANLLFNIMLMMTLKHWTACYLTLINREKT